MAIVTKFCEWCGGEFQARVFPSRPIERSRFCSLSCSAQATAQERTRRNTVRKTCPICGNQFYTRGSSHSRQYCSRDCADKAHSVRMRSKPSTKITLTCNYCGRQFQRYRCRLKDGKRHFCDSKCWAAYKAEHAKRKVHIFQTDIPHRGYGPGWKTLRRKLLREANFTCEECGVFSYCLEVHHKVPLREFNGDWRKANERSNLKVVCDACHGKLDSQIP